MATPLRYGTEFVINTTLADVQFTPDITGLADGRFVATWADLSRSADDPSALAIRAQVFNADGSKARAEFLVNTDITESQLAPAVTALAGGGFVVTWQDENPELGGGDGSGGSVKAQVFGASGRAVGSEILANTSVLNSQEDPTITTLTNGRFVVAWRDASQFGVAGAFNDIRAQVFDVNGSKFGAEVLLTTAPGSNQLAPSITALSNGRFVASWLDQTLSFGTEVSNQIKARVFNADGTPFSSDFQVNTITTDIQFDARVTALTNGRFVVSWTDNSQSVTDPSSLAIRAQVFDASGAAVGAEFLAATNLANKQEHSDIMGLSDGRFVIAWVDGSFVGGDGQGSAIKAQLFNGNGSKSGDEFLVNTTTSGNQSDPTVSELADGRFVVAWGSENVGDIFAQIFDPREAAVSLTGGALADQFVGTRFGDTLSGGKARDDLKGADGADQLFGGMGGDILTGGGGNDTLVGGAGQDVLRGGAGADVFVFGAAGDTPVANPDRIADFAHGVDLIDLGGFMAGGVFIAGAGFDGVAGEVRYDAGSLSGDVDGNMVADWSIILTGNPAIDSGDLRF